MAPTTDPSLIRFAIPRGRMYDGLALLNGFVCIVDSIADAVAASDAVAPEHLEIMTRNPRDVSAAVRNAGAIFCGTAAGEVLGDYGAGPNHTLPTGGTARFRAGLSVFDFIRVRTWMELESADRGGEMLADTRRLAEIEGLAGHARAAVIRGAG